MHATTSLRSLRPSCSRPPSDRRRACRPNQGEDDVQNEQAGGPARIRTSHAPRTISRAGALRAADGGFGPSSAGRCAESTKMSGMITFPKSHHDLLDVDLATLATIGRAEMPQQT